MKREVAVFASVWQADLKQMIVIQAVAAQQEKILFDRSWNKSIADVFARIET